MRFTVGCQCCNCATWTITVRSSCSGTPAIAGATVTIGATSLTTNSSGQATFTNVPRGSSGTVTATGYASGSFTVSTSCTNQTISLTPNVGTASFSAFLCPGNNCDPSATAPVSATYTQTSGGTATGTVTINSSSHVNVSLPVGTYTVVWSASGMVTQTITGLTISACLTSGWSANLVPVSYATAWCWPNAGVETQYPTTIYITFDSSTDWGPLAGTTQTLPLTSSSGLTWSACVNFLCPGSNPTSATITVSIFQSSCNSTVSASITVVAYTGSNCNSGPQQAFMSDGAQSLGLNPLSGTSAMSGSGLCTGLGGATGNVTLSQ